MDKVLKEVDREGNLISRSGPDLSVATSARETEWLEPKQSNEGQVARRQWLSPALYFGHLNVICFMIQAFLNHWWAWFFASFAVVAVSGIYGVRKLVPILKPRFIVEDLNSKECHLVGLEILVDEAAIGNDQGVTGVDDGLLYFTGSACSFALGIQDIDAGFSMKNFWRGRLNPSFCGFLLKLRHPAKTVHLSIAPSDLRNYEVGKLLQQFVDQAKPSNLPRSFPPVTSPDRVLSDKSST